MFFGAIYHWYPKITGRMLNERLGKFHFWVTFLGAYVIYFPMHYLGFLGVPRRYYEMGETAFVPPSAATLNIFITIAALIVGAAQMVFLFNLIWSLYKGKPAGGNPWRATTLEWQTPQTPPGHGNWGKELPVVYRWAYDYSVPGAEQDFRAAKPAPGHTRTLGNPAMNITFLFLAVIAAIVAWWLAQQRLTAKPGWRRVRSAIPAGASSLPAAKIGLGVFLAVVGSLFALLISAYSMRMEMGEWRPAPAPKLLWLNTGMLILSSGALQWAQVAARRGRMDGVRAGLLAGGVFALAFLAGQLIAWRQLDAAGYYLTANPAAAFFYLITGVHGLHILGGLVALGRTMDKAWRGVELGQCA